MGNPERFEDDQASLLGIKPSKPSTLTEMKHA